MSGQRSWTHGASHSNESTRYLHPTPTNPKSCEDLTVPSSKFTTKAYGPTKPAICEKQQLPPGVLPAGPGQLNMTHFLLKVQTSGSAAEPVSGSAPTHATGNPELFQGFTTIGPYKVTIDFHFNRLTQKCSWEWVITKGGTFITRGNVTDATPRTMDPFDTGIVVISQSGDGRREVIRTVAVA